VAIKGIAENQTLVVSERKLLEQQERLIRRQAILANEIIDLKRLIDQVSKTLVEQRSTKKD